MGPVLGRTCGAGGSSGNAPGAMVEAGGALRQRETGRKQCGNQHSARANILADLCQRMMFFGGKVNNGFDGCVDEFGREDEGSGKDDNRPIARRNPQP